MQQSKFGAARPKGYIKRLRRSGEGRTDSKSLQMGDSWPRAHKQLNYQQAQAKLSNRATDPKKNNLNRGNNKLKNNLKLIKNKEK